MRKSILLQSMSQHELYHYIVRIMKQKFGRLPTSGVIAGQAVASAIYSILDIAHTGPYNDLDVFGTESELPQGIFNTNRYRPVYNRNNSDQSVEFYEGSFSCVAGVINVGSYSIEDSTVDPDNFKINYVKINVQNTKKTTGFGKHILSGFDINCVQVGIDVRSEQVFWTPEFLEFLDKRKIEVSFYGTPMHTAVRLLKKKKALPWAKLDIPIQMGKLQTVRQLIRTIEDERSTEGNPMLFPGNLFSEIYRARAADYENILGKYFTMDYRTLNLREGEKGSVESVNFYLLQPTSYDEDTLSEFINLIDAAGNTLGEASQFSNLEFLIRLFTKFKEAKDNQNWETIKSSLYKFMPKGDVKSKNNAIIYMHINETLFDPTWEEEARQISADDFDAIANMATNFTAAFNLARSRGLLFTSLIAKKAKIVEDIKAKYLVRLLNGGIEDLTPPDLMDFRNIDNWAHPLFLKVITPYVEQEREKMKNTIVPFTKDESWLSELSTDVFSLKKYENLKELHDAIDPHHWSAQIMMNADKTYLPIYFNLKHSQGETVGTIILRNYSVETPNGDKEYHWSFAEILFSKEGLSNEESNALYLNINDSMVKLILDHLRGNHIRLKE